MNNVSLRNKNHSTTILLLVSIITAGYSLAEIVGSPRGGEDWFIPITFCAFLWVTFYLIAAWRTFKHIYLYSTAYLLALILFHHGLLFQRTIGNIRFPGDWENGSYSHWLENAGWHSIFAISSFGIGFVIAVTTGKNYPKYVNETITGAVKKIGRWSAVGLLIASLFFFVLAIKSYGNIFDYARHELFSSHADSRGFGAFMMIFPGAVLLNYFSAVTRKQKMFATALAIFAFLLFMLTGYRSYALFPMLVGVMLWVKSGRRLPLPIFIGGIFLTLILIAASGYLRTVGKYSQIGADDVSKALEEAQVESSISEMGASIKALASVLQLVPYKDDYRFGSSYFNSMIDSFPNVGVQINSESSRDYAMKQKMSNPEVVKRMRPADWLTFRIAPWHFSKGYGVGFSAIAEPYLNFGTSGVFVFFVILGYFLGRLDTMPLYSSPYFFIFGTSMLWLLVSTVRNDSSNLFKPCVFTFLILVVWWGVSKLFLNKAFKWRA